MNGTALFDRAVLSGIAAEAAAAWPREGCGALLGQRSSGATLSITLSLPVPNSETERPRDRFEVSPRDYLAVEDEAVRRGLSLLGFWHSHPEGAARPSATDRAFAWEGLLTVIVAVAAREPGEIGAFEIRGTDAPFSPVGILESGNNRPVTRLGAVAP